MNLDIRSTVLLLVILASLGAVWSIYRAYRAIRAGKRLPFFYKRRQQYERAFRNVVLAIIGVAAALLLFRGRTLDLSLFSIT